MASLTNGNTVDKGSILFVGNALLDVTFRGTKEFLDEQGLKANDAILLDEDRYKSIHGALAKQFKAEDYVPGGASQNAARTTSWMLVDYPGTVSFMGKVTDDEMGKILYDKNQQAGVLPIYQYETDGTPTGCCLVILNDQNRSLCAFLGAALKFSEGHVKDNWAAVEKAKTIYIEGFFLSTCLEACRMLGSHVADHPEKRFCLNLSAEFVVTVHKAMLLEMMPYVDILFGNDTEAGTFGKEMNFGTDLKKIASSIAGMEKKRGDRKRIVVITCGSDPVIVAVGPDQLFTSDVNHLSPEKIIDTNGAGDAFVGGFLAQLVRGKTLEQCVRTGSHVGAIVIQRLGCTFPTESPNLDEVCK